MSHQNRGLCLRHDRSTKGYQGLGRRVFLIQMLVALAGLALALQACGPVEAAKERENGAMKKTHSASSVVRPPIDASAPVKTETATFALG